MFFFNLCAHVQLGSSPFGALQVRPITQEVREKAVELIHIGPEDAISGRKHTLPSTEESSY